MAKAETYVSLDIETDGPAPGINSMLALGAVAFNNNGEEIGYPFYKTIYPIDGFYQNSDTMKWWATQPKAWEEVNNHRVLPLEALNDFNVWLKGLPNKLVAVGWPIAFDFAFVNYYLWRYTNNNPLGFAGLDIRSFAMGLTKSTGYYNFEEAQLRKLTPKIDKTHLRPHVAVDDAIEQGRLFAGLMHNVK